MADRTFVPHEQCKVASGECFRLGYCISGCVETPLTKWDRLERENYALRQALAPFARLADKPMGFAAVEYTVRGDPERQTFKAPQFQRAFNRAAEVYAMRFAAGVDLPDGVKR